MQPESKRLLGLEQLPQHGELGYARDILNDYDPWCEEQARIRDRILSFMAEHSDAALRTCAPGHLTASALVLEEGTGRCLLTLHRKLQRWLQLGGHCDGDTNLVRAALCEALEESGIEDLRIDPAPIDVDIHTIPARPKEPEHLHLDTRFVVWAPNGAKEVISAESSALAWFELKAIEALDTDDSVRRLARLIAPA